MSGHVAPPRAVVAHVLPWPGIGGTEHATLRVARAADVAGHASVMYYRSDAPAVGGLARSAGFEAEAYDPVEPGLRTLRPYLAHSVRLARSFRRRGVRIVHCADVLGAFHAGIAATLCGAPLIAHVRNPHTDLERRHCHFLRLVDRFAFVSHDTRRRFPCVVDEAKAQVLYDGVPATDEPDPDVGALRAGLGIGEEVPVVGMVARVSPQKDFSTLARAAVIVRQRHPSVRFVIVGDHEGEETNRRHYAEVREELRRLGIDAAFVFTGYRADVSRLLRALDVFVLSTHVEGLPLVVLEAMAAGVPVVATAVNGVPELVRTPVVGRTFAHGDHAALASHLIDLVDDPAAARALGRRGRAFAREEFGAARFDAAIAEMYDRVLSPAGRVW